MNILITMNWSDCSKNKYLMISLRNIPSLNVFLLRIKWYAKGISYGWFLIRCDYLHKMIFCHSNLDQRFLMACTKLSIWFNCICYTRFRLPTMIFSSTWKCWKHFRPSEIHQNFSIWLRHYTKGWNISYRFFFWWRKNRDQKEKVIYQLSVRTIFFW